MGWLIWIMKKKPPENDQRKLGQNLGLLSKLLVEMIPILEGYMQTEKDLAASLAALKASIDALGELIAATVKSSDLTSDVANVDALKTMVDTLSASLTPPAAPAA